MLSKHEIKEENIFYPKTITTLRKKQKELTEIHETSYIYIKTIGKYLSNASIILYSIV